MLYCNPKTCADPTKRTIAESRSEGIINSSIWECPLNKIDVDQYRDEEKNTPIDFIHLLTILLIILDEFRNHFLNSTDNHVVGNLVDRRIGI